jgi:hypothetical protein
MSADASLTYREAQRFIRVGQPVFPCRPAGAKAKAPMTKNGLNDATLNKEQVKRWLRVHPDAALGIPTGHLWDVLDVDVKAGQDGRVHLPYLHRMGLLNGCQRVVRTPSGGWHLYFKAAKGLTNKARAALGLDVRALGGYVLAPPSYLTGAVTSTGDVYSGAYTDMGPTEDSTEDPLLFDLIVSTLAPIDTNTNKPIELLGYERQSSIAALRGWLSERTPGERNNSLHWAVCRCIDNGIDPHELVEVALMLGLTEEEVSKTIDSALRRAGVASDDLASEAEALFGNG